MKRLNFAKTGYGLALGVALGVGAVLCSAQQAVAQQGSQSSASEPAGWVGVTIQSPTDTVDGTVMTYPVITEVIPGSPADHAGLAAGDTILKYDTNDARVTSRFKQFLQPGRRIKVTVRRNEVRVLNVVVGKKVDDPVWNFFAPSPAPSSAVNFTVQGTASVTLGGDGNFSICPLTPIAAPATMRETSTLAGASLVQMNADIAQTLHVQNNGVFVLSVAPGTTARQAGLKGGDVILMIGANPVKTPAAVFQLVAQVMNTVNHITLSIVRDGQTRTIKLPPQTKKQTKKK